MSVQYTINAVREGSKIRIQFGQDQLYASKPINSIPAGSDLAESDEDAIENIKACQEVLIQRGYPVVLLGGAEQLMNGTLKAVEEVVESSVSEEDEEEI